MKRNVSATLRDAIVWRDGWVCRICKNDLIEDQWQCDHILPLWNGGSNDRENLQAICANCHAGKSARETRERNAKKKKEALEAVQRDIQARAEKYGFSDLQQYVYDPEKI